MWPNRINIFYFLGVCIVVRRLNWRTRGHSWGPSRVCIANGPIRPSQRQSMEQYCARSPSSRSSPCHPPPPVAAPINFGRWCPYTPAVQINCTSIWFHYLKEEELFTRGRNKEGIGQFDGCVGCDTVPVDRFVGSPVHSLADFNRLSSDSIDGPPRFQLPWFYHILCIISLDLNVYIRDECIRRLSRLTPPPPPVPLLPLVCSDLSGDPVI